MIIEDQSLESLLGRLCDRVRVSARQSDDAAVREARRRLIHNSGDEAAIHVVAASSLVNQRPEKSLALLKQSPDLLHRDPVANRLAGYAWLAQNDQTKAQHSFDKSVQLDPCQPDCWTVLGQIAETSGKREGAIHYYERAIVFDNDRHDAALALARLYARNKEVDDAIHTLRVCLMRDRRSPKLNLALAKLLNRRSNVLGRRGMRRAKQKVMLEALRCYQTANAAMPSASALVAQGLMQKRMQKFDDAKHSFERAIQLDSESKGAYIQLANVNVDSGNISEALEQFEHAFSLGECSPSAHFRYTRAKKFRSGRATKVYLKLLRERLQCPKLRDRGRLHLNFALAKVLEDVKRYDEAWAHYDQGNRLNAAHSQSESRRKRKRPTDSVPLERLTNDSIDLFTPEFFAKHQGVGNPSETPVFIVGIPRSGTTLTEQILSSHPEIAGAGELKYVDHIRRDLGRLYKSSPAADAAVEYPRSMTGVNPGCLRELADQYLTQLDRFRTTEARVTDKMPTNFTHLGMIATLFPRATVIYCRRNPMDVLVSGYCQNLNAPFCDLDMIVHYHRNHRRMMAHWENVLPIKIHTVDYESLVADPETQSRALIQHCGLDWDERCLSFHENRRAVHTPSKWQVRQPMYASSVEKWRRFEKHLQPVADQINDDALVS